MTPHKQRFAHKPEEGIYGDCCRTVIACILDIEPEEVPHYHRMLADGEQSDLMNEWLLGRDLQLVQIPYDSDPDDVLSAMRKMNPGLTYLLAGLSRTGVDHYVIAKDDKIIHDPSLTDAGIIGRGSDGYTWVGFVVYRSKPVPLPDELKR